MNILTAYENALKLGNKSANTIRAYKKDVALFLNFFKISTVEEVKALGKMDIEAFYGSQTSLSASSLAGLVRNLMAFFHWLDVDETHAFFSVKFGSSRYPKVSQQVKDVLTSEECVRLIEAGEDPQVRFMIALMLFTALRRGAVRKIKMSDIQDCVISNVQEKGGKIRKTFMDETLCIMFEVYKAQRNSTSEYVFYGRHGEKGENGMISGESINQRVKDAIKRAGIQKKITAHRLRGTRITQLIQTKGIQAAQLVAGHASINTTKLYDASSEDFVRDILLNK